MRPSIRPLVLLASSLALLASSAPAQTLLGADGSGLLAWEFSPSPGGPCPAPTPFAASCSYAAGACGITGPGPMPPGSVLGDIADDPRTDTFYLTDGFVIEQYTMDNPCSGPMSCVPQSMFMSPSVLGPITGMCFDNSSSLALGSGTPLLWITDGAIIVALSPGPPGSCSATLAFGPCLIQLPNPGLMTDITWDHSTDTMWACDSMGFVHNIDIVNCTWLSQLSPPSCGLAAPLTGIAFDLGTPPSPPLPAALPALYVTDGFNVERMDVSGLPATPTFGSPMTCTPTPAYLSGLALTQHGSTYGSTWNAARLDSYGHSTTPSTLFGLEVYNAPAGDNAWLLLGYNWPTPGYYCPPLIAVGTNIWVDFSFPGSVTFLGPLPGPCVTLPATIPAGTPLGLELYAQVVFIPPGGPPASDSTNGLIVTVMTP